HLVHLIEKDLLAGLLGQWVQTQGVLIHGAIVLDAWRWGGSDGEVLQTFPSASHYVGLAVGTDQYSACVQRSAGVVLRRSVTFAQGMSKKPR
ncbi:MAG: hypothetical protein J0H16_11155, partial [Alicycliphilus denitrificans]|nr:hypothetical protein [Alicycliphilus denitrificans]